METTTNSLSSAKWSRNLNKDCQSEANRLRLLERQRQLIESKLQRRQQQNTNIVSSSSSISSSRPATSMANLRSGLVLQKSSTDSPIDSNNVHDDFNISNDETILMKDLRANRARTSVPGSRTIISSLDSSPFKLERTLPNNNKNNNIDGYHNKPLGSNSQFASNKSLRDIRSISKSEANLNSAIANDESAITNNRNNNKFPSPNPLTTVLTDEELLKFVSQPISPDVTLQCTIIRDKKGLDRSLYPTYYMHLQDIVQNNLTIKSPDLEKTKANKIEGTATVWMSDSLESINSNEDSIDAEIEEKSSKTLLDQQQQQIDNRSNNIPSSRKVFVLSGRRRKKSKTYLIGNNAFDISRDRCIAKLKSNVLGTQFTAIRLHQNGVRYEISSVTYETNVLGFKGPRKMTIIIPKTDEEELKRNSRAIMLLKNKTPIWNEETQSYVLNFHGRVTQASVKNFQLVVQDSNNNNKKTNDATINETFRRSASSHQLRQCYSGATDNFDDNDDFDDDNDKYINTNPTKLQKNQFSKSGYLTASSSEDAKQIADTNELVSLQFGRVSNTHFSCDVSWPLSLLQAFSIALSSFDSKLACE